MVFYQSDNADAASALGKMHGASEQDWPQSDEAHQIARSLEALAQIIPLAKRGRDRHFS